MSPRTFSISSACIGLVLALAEPCFAPVRGEEETPETPAAKAAPAAEARPAPAAAKAEVKVAAPAIQGAVQAQVIRQVIVNGMFFGGEDAGEADDTKASYAKPDPAGSQLLEFADGSHLHGTLATLETREGHLTWQRTDASAPLTFPLTEIGRLKVHDEAKSEPKVHATVKLTGGDWLAADVAGLTEKKIQLKMDDGSALAVDREKVEWIYFSKNAAPECYDGPTSMAGWNSAGGWTFRDGALRATMPAAIGRNFEALPDQAEYFLEVDQGAAGHAFTLMLHSDNIVNRGRGVGRIQMMFRGSDLRMWMQNENQMKSEQVDLSKILPELNGGGGGEAEKKTVQFHVLEDFTGGRLLIYINGRKAADWSIEKGKPGESRGGVTFQPQGWNPDSEQVISQFRVLPWDGRVPKDGAADEAAAKTDLVSLGGGDARAGVIEALNGEHLKLRADGGTVEIARAKVTMLRFHRVAKPTDEDPPAAHVQLAERGEFDVTSLSSRQGRFTMRTNFGGELTLAAAAVRGIEFARAPWSPPKPADELVFHNGDRLRGTLESTNGERDLRWHIPHADTLIAFETAGLAGVGLAPPADLPEARTAIVARLRNGDTLGGTLVQCDAENLVLECAPAGQFAVARSQVQALYFPTEGNPPVLDSAARRKSWAGVEYDPMGRSTPTDEKKPERPKPKLPSAWHTFDGAFTYSPLDQGFGNPTRMASLALAGDFEAMPQVVELDFDIAVPRPQVSMSAQLFYDDNNQGYLLQLFPNFLYLYDNSARQQMRGAGQQHIEFGDKVNPKAHQRHLRILADRRTGKLLIIVDGALVCQMGPKPGSPPRNLGRRIMLTNSAMGSCAFTNLWIGPWDGRPPDLAPAPDSPPHTVLLANGDETHGTVGEITPEAARIESEAGAIELPTPRLVAIDFGGAPPARTTGARIRFSDWGALTLKSFRTEKDEVVCQSELAGEFRLARALVREISFPAPAGKSGAEKKREP